MTQPKPPPPPTHPAIPPPKASPPPPLLSSRQSAATTVSWLQTTCMCWTDRKHQVGRSVLMSSESDRVSSFCCCRCSLHWLSAASTCLPLLSVVSGTGPEFWTIYTPSRHLSSASDTRLCQIPSFKTERKKIWPGCCFIQTPATESNLLQTQHLAISLLKSGLGKNADLFKELMETLLCWLCVLQDCCCLLVTVSVVRNCRLQLLCATRTHRQWPEVTNLETRMEQARAATGMCRAISLSVVSDCMHF